MDVDTKDEIRKSDSHVVIGIGLGVIGLLAFLFSVSVHPSEDWQRTILGALYIAPLIGYYVVYKAGKAREHVDHEVTALKLEESHEQKRQAEKEMSQLIKDINEYKQVMHRTDHNIIEAYETMKFASCFKEWSIIYIRNLISKYSSDIHGSEANYIKNLLATSSIKDGRAGILLKHVIKCMDLCEKSNTLSLSIVESHLCCDCKNKIKKLHEFPLKHLEAIYKNDQLVYSEIAELVLNASRDDGIYFDSEENKLKQEKLEVKERMFWNDLDERYPATDRYSDETLKYAELSTFYLKGLPDWINDAKTS